MQSFEDRIKHYIRIHRELHGIRGFTWEDVLRDFMGSFPEENAMEVMDEIERQEQQTEKGPILDFGSNQEEHF